jgi:homogentisate 1,2-dioxygenase
MISVRCHRHRINCAGIRNLCQTPTDFIDGWLTMAGNGSADAQSGCAIHLYAANRDMNTRFYYNADAELLIIPQQGRLHIRTELGRMNIEPQEIAVIPRGIRFQVQLPDGEARGYVCENFGSMFRLPDLGVIGSNGLANPRDFRRRSRGMKIKKAILNCWPNSAAICGRQKSAIRRSMWSPGMAISRRTNTICVISIP